MEEKEEEQKTPQSSRSHSETRHVPTLPDLQPAAISPHSPLPPHAHARRSSSSISSSRRQSFNSMGAAPPHRHSRAFSAEEIVNAMEFEQENIVNRLQKELNALRAQQEHHILPAAATSPALSSIAPPPPTTTSTSNTSLSRQSSSRSVSRVPTQTSYPSSPALHTDEFELSNEGEGDYLRRENEILRRRIRDLTQRLSEKTLESERAQKSALELKEKLELLQIDQKDN